MRSTSASVRGAAVAGAHAVSELAASTRAKDELTIEYRVSSSDGIWCGECGGYHLYARTADYDYRIDFPGSGHHWTELRCTSLGGEGGDSSLIGISFAADAVDPMLEDIAVANGAHLYRGEASLQALRMAGNATAVRQLIACLRSFPGYSLPALPRAEAASAAR